MSTPCQAKPMDPADSAESSKKLDQAVEVSVFGHLTPLEKGPVVPSIKTSVGEPVYKAIATRNSDVFAF